MDFEQNIFLPLPNNFEKKAYANLSHNVADWVHDITKMVYDKLGYITQFPTKIKIERADEQRGYGYGSIKVGEAIDIPLIIENFELKPMDIFTAMGEFHPLSERRIEELMFNPEVFGKPTSNQNTDQSTYSSSYPPHSGKYVYAGARLLEKLSGRVTEQAKAEFAQVAGDAAYFAAFRQNGHLNLLKTAANLRVRTNKDVSSILPVDIIQIEKVSNDQFKVMATSDRIYAPKETIIGKKDLWRKFGAKVTDEVLDKGLFTTIKGSRPYKPYILENLEGEKAKNITSVGKYEVMDIDGDRRLGWVCPTVIDFDLKKTGDKLFTDGLSYSLQGDIVGIAATSATNPEDGDEPPYCELQHGKTGVFIISRGGSTICTVPISITSPIMDQGTHVRFEASDIYGRPFVVEVSPGVKSITKHKHQYNVYLIPADAKFISVGRKVIRLQDNAKDYKDNELAFKIAKEKDVIVVSCSDGDTYSLAGNNLKELVADSRGVGRSKARWYLVSLGLSPNEADRALDVAKSNGSTKIVDTKPLLTQAEKQGSVLADRVVPLLNSIKAYKINLVKEASVLDDEQVVDKVLALNFLTPENISTFLTFLPSLEDAASKLAQLLIAVRLGLKRIPESAVQSAMRGLEVTISGLRGMEALQDVNVDQDSL